METPPPGTPTAHIAYFVSDTTTAQRGLAVTLQWAAENRGQVEDFPSCDATNQTSLLSSVPVDHASHDRWFVRAEEVLDSIASSYSVGDKWWLCRSENSGSSAICSFTFAGAD